MVAKANNQVWRLRQMAQYEARPEQMIVIVQRYIMPHLELSAPMWHFMITVKESNMIEDVIKDSLRIIYGERYGGYHSALKRAGMIRMDERRAKLTKKFAIKTYSHEKFKEWYVRIDQKEQRTRGDMNPNLVKPSLPNTERLRDSAIPKFIEIINNNRDQIRADLLRRVECRRCGKAYTSMYNLSQHHKYQHSAPGHQCLQCPQNYSHVQIC